MRRELYFKHRYREANYPVGTLTEYFRFEAVKPVLDDLFAIPPKVLAPEEMELLGEVGA
ncbi:MAG: hypothetical protein SWY16_26075 [Cyanobacteriota bacterium]|nr:hypothetical protein [Cyanobacteriota bacterium]